MSDEEREDEVAARARAHLDETARDLDAVTIARLRAARLRALDALRAAREPWPRRRLAIAGATGALGLLVALSWWQRVTQEGDGIDVAFDDIEILAAKDDLQFYDDDLEFYRWLEESEPI